MARKGKAMPVLRYRWRIVCLNPKCNDTNDRHGTVASSPYSYRTRYAARRNGNRWKPEYGPSDTHPLRVTVERKP